MYIQMLGSVFHKAPCWYEICLASEGELRWLEISFLGSKYVSIFGQSQQEVTRNGDVLKVPGWPGPHMNCPTFHCQ